MNDRIFELGKQATIWCCDNLNPDTPREDWDAAWEQKFAELIIQECISTIENAENGYQDYRNQIEDAMRDHCIRLVKRKFGVLE